MRRRIPFFLLAALCIVGLDASPALAHGAAAIPGQDRDVEWLRNVLFVAVAVAAVVLLRMPARAVAPHCEDPEQTTNKAFLVGRFVGSFGFALVAYLALAGATADPFGVAVRTVSEFWFLLPVMSVFGAFWCVLSPALIGSAKSVATPDANWVTVVSLLACVWFWLCYVDSHTSSAIAIACVIYLAFIALLRVRKGFEFTAASDPFVAISRLMARKFAPIGVAVVALSAVLFETMQEQSWWIKWVTALGGVQLTLIRTAGLLGVIIGIGAIVLVASCTASYFSRVPLRKVVGWMAAGLMPLILALLLAHDLYPFMTALQDQLFVLWDPFGNGWTLNDGRQGITVNLIDDYLGVVQNVALIMGPVLAMVLAHRQMRRETLPSVASAAVPIFAGLVGIGYLAIAWMVPA